MWLINTQDYRLVEFTVPERNSYAILSHTWQDEGEVSYHDMADIASARTRPGFWKIEQTCQEALRRSLKYAWVDTCCIDKKSSAELQEAINSMFEWYRQAEICFAYLDDIKSTTQSASYTEHLERSRYFSRAWTLQELIAPDRLLFFGQQWVNLGPRADWAAQISAATRIPEELLTNNQERRTLGLTRMLMWYSVAQRMSWAAGRQCRRIEDRAYSLLGIFNAHMPLLYGEGKRAFKRLQEEIMQANFEMSILAWDNQFDFDDTFATSPDEFEHSASFIKDFPWHKPSELLVTNIGWAMKVMTLEVRDSVGRAFQVALLGCLDERDKHNLLALRLSRCDESNYNVWIESDPLIATPASRGTARLWKIDIVYARSNAVQRNVVLREDLDHLHFRSAVSGFDDRSNHVWVKMSAVGIPTQWKVIDVFPSGHWNWKDQALLLSPEYNCLANSNNSANHIQSAGLIVRIPELTEGDIHLAVAVNRPHNTGDPFLRSDVFISVTMNPPGEISIADTCERLLAAPEVERSQSTALRPPSLQALNLEFQASVEWLKVAHYKILLVSLSIQGATQYAFPTILEARHEHKQLRLAKPWKYSSCTGRGAML